MSCSQCTSDNAPCDFRNTTNRVLLRQLRPSATPAARVLLVAIVTVHLPNRFSSIKLLSDDATGAQFGQPGYEGDSLGLIALCVGGAGRFSATPGRRAAERHDRRASPPASPVCDSPPAVAARRDWSRRAAVPVAATAYATPKAATAPARRTERAARRRRPPPPWAAQSPRRVRRSLSPPSSPRRPRPGNEAGSPAGRRKAASCGGDGECSARPA